MVPEDPVSVTYSVGRERDRRRLREAWMEGGRLVRVGDVQRGADHPNKTGFGWQ